ncbi:hypothetical protein [Novilysobacter erysipheiresistens]|uniref:Uncharacterized protein n=1 Tax=Novilysobacter erysipheiresistens TaxID=1749332 RepID=A0ABU7YVZ3_9GAMM
MEERFHACFEGGVPVEFVWNGRDHVSGGERSVSTIADVVKECNDQHFELFLRWHDRNEWERGFLCLAPGRERGLVMLPSALYLPPKEESAMGVVAALARYTGIMSSF